MLYIARERERETQVIIILSTTEGRKNRMEPLLKVLRQAQKPLTPNEIAQRTELLTEITMDRLYKYLEELVWSDILIKQENRYFIFPSSSMKNERERRIKKETKKGKEADVLESRKN